METYSVIWYWKLLTKRNLKDRGWKFELRRHLEIWRWYVIVLLQSILGILHWIPYYNELILNFIILQGLKYTFWKRKGDYHLREFVKLTLSLSLFFFFFLTLTNGKLAKRTMRGLKKRVKILYWSGCLN